MTGTQTVADSVLAEPKSLRLQAKHLAAGAKKSATEGKTAPFKIRFTRGYTTGRSGTSAVWLTDC